MNLVYISGPPAVGKLTVATQLADLTGYKLFHNHVSIVAIEPIFEFGSASFWRLVHELRLRVMETAAQDDIDLIFTNVYEHSTDSQLAQGRFQAVEQRGGRVCLVALTCEASAHEGRVDSPSRKEMRKLADLDEWRVAMATRDTMSPIPGRDSLVLDTTHLSPRDAAMAIIKHYGLPEENTR